MDAQTKKNLAIQHFREGRYLFEAYSKEANALAIRHFEEAIKWDPDLAIAHAWLAYTVAEDGRQNWADDPSATLKLALDLAEQAVRMAPDNYYTHWTLASVTMLLDFPGAWQHYEKAEELMGNNIDPIMRAEFLAERSEYISCRGEKGDPDRAIRDIVAAKDLSAHDKILHWVHWLHAFAYFQKEDYATASGLFQSVSYIGNGISNITYILFAICEAYLGRPIPPDEVIARCRIKYSDWTAETMERLPFQKKEDLDRFQQGLKLAKLIP